MKFVESEAAVEAKSKAFANERAMFTSLVQENHGDIYKVVSMGTTIDFTDKYKEAEKTFNDAGTPKQMFLINRETGTTRFLLNTR